MKIPPLFFVYSVVVTTGSPPVYAHGDRVQAPKVMATKPNKKSRFIRLTPVSYLIVVNIFVIHLSHPELHY
jgi:hypothetical protein